MFSEEELLEIGRFAKKHNLMILSDEVYDCLAFHPTKHIRIAALEDFWERTITCGSAGKSFACTGWRIGWCMGPEHLIAPTTAATARIVFCVNSPMQEAVAGALATKGDFFEQQRREYVERREVLTSALDRLGVP